MTITAQCKSLFVVHINFDSKQISIFSRNCMNLAFRFIIVLLTEIILVNDFTITSAAND